MPPPRRSVAGSLPAIGEHAIFKARSSSTLETNVAPVLAIARAHCLAGQLGVEGLQTLKVKSNIVIDLACAKVSMNHREVTYT